jgi:hypothetical protein
MNKLTNRIKGSKLIKLINYCKQRDNEYPDYHFYAGKTYEGDRVEFYISDTQYEVISKLVNFKDLTHFEVKTIKMLADPQ